MIFIDGHGNIPGCKCGQDCEMPCWQRVGLTTCPCCKDCPPIPSFDEEVEDAA